MARNDQWNIFESHTSLTSSDFLDARFSFICQQYESTQRLQSYREPHQQKEF